MARAEVLGGVSYQSWGKQENDPPMFVAQDAELSVSIATYDSGTRFSEVVSETEGNQTKVLPNKDMASFVAVYRSGR